MNSPQLFARPLMALGALRGETALRYGAAAAVTLIALAAAQLVVPTSFVLWLAAITLAGVPISLWARASDGRIGNVIVPRPLWNAATVLATGAFSVYFLRAPLQNLWSAVRVGTSESLVQMGQAEPMVLLVQLFLIFAAFRSWTLLSDKDATLATVPSFSVLLLLIPVHRSVEVVCYFLLWTVAATILLALEHRSEMRALVVAAVPAPAPGQDVRLAARSLAGVLGISLVAAIALSGFLTARDPKEGSSSESAVAQMASRWTQWGVEWMNGNASTGPQRQIDFSARNSPPTRAKLWEVAASAADGSALYPAYWRLFALSEYDGSTWSQSSESAQSVARTALSPTQWPFRQFSRDGYGGGERGEFSDGRGGFGEGRGRVGDGRFREGRRGDGPYTFFPDRRSAEDGRSQERRRISGFAVASARPELASRFGTPQHLVYYTLNAARPNLGFVPVLAPPWSVVLRRSEQETIRVRSDGSVDMNVTNADQTISAFSRVAALGERGFMGASVPKEKLAPRAGAPLLSAQERALNLKLPDKVPARVRQLARAVVSRAAPGASNFARAQLLAQATQKDAIYTLRPPAVPSEREAADFFLFESRRGFCTYFAGSLAVLCRSAGIPARVVSGFATPPQQSSAQITLRDANLHAWTEVWVENWGWAIVDATPADDRGDNAPTFLENWGDLSASQLDALARRARANGLGLASAGALLFLLVTGWRARPALMRRLRREVVQSNEVQRREVALAYRATSRELARRFRPRAAWETPDEWLRAAQSALPQLPGEPLQQLTDLYVRARFSPRALEANAAQKARQARQNLRWPKRRFTLKERS